MTRRARAFSPAPSPRTKTKTTNDGGHTHARPCLAYGEAARPAATTSTRQETVWTGAYLDASGVPAAFGVEVAALALVRVAVHDGDDEVALEVL